MKNLFDEIRNSNLLFFAQYEALAQSYYRVYAERDPGEILNISKANVNALLTLLEESGYVIHKPYSSDGNGNQVIKFHRS